jgi:queuine/archaeosine tRNA-ribosyltransferase
MCPAIYLPVMPVFMKHREGWWNNKSTFKYSYAFASYLTHKTFKKLRDEFMFDSDIVLYSDSGGYATFSRGVSVDPYELAEWYNSAGIDLAMQLDFPPYVDARKSRVVEFDERLELTARSSKILLERVKSSIGLYATIHGNNVKQYDVWRTTMEMISDSWFGWAVGVAPVNDPDAVLRLIRYLETIKNDKPVHFFECGDAICFLLIARYANKRGLLVTADSTYASTAAQSGWLYMTVFGKLVTIGPKQEVSFKTPLACLCPICSKFGADSVREDAELLILHNTFMLVWRYQYLNAISTEKPEAFRQLLPEAIPYIRQLDAILEKRGGLLYHV